MQLQLASLLLVSVAAAVPPGSAAERASGGTEEARAYCDYVQGAAASESARVRSPWLFSSFGTLSGSLASPDVGASLASGRELLFRLQAGIGVSPTRMYQAGLLQDRAAAECERHRAEREISLLLAPGGLNRSALQAQVEVLEQALPRAAELLAESERLLQASRTTLQEHSATALRVDALRGELSALRMQLEATPPAPTAPERAGSAGDAFERLRRFEAQKQEVESSLRKAAALDLTLRGGYDEIFGVGQSLPVFGSLTLELSPGWFWQRGEEERAQRAHRAWVEAQMLGANAGLTQAQNQLQAQLVLARRRLQEVSTALADLELRLARAEDTQGPQAREYAEYIWFDVVRLQGEKAFLAEQVRTLTRAAPPARPSEP
jgi:hypothetical protein